MTGRMYANVIWPDGQSSLGFGGGPGPPASGASSFILIARPALDPSTLSPDGAELSAYIAQGESRRR